jgi:alkyldihydroxyacetonephosphate synthase
MAHRISQVYDTGACIYFYWGYRCDSQQNAIEIFHEIHNLVRHEVLASGGSISHHHGVGKHRSFWYEQTVSKLGVQLLKSAKHELDPKNIFAIGNLISEKSENDELTAKL